MKDFKLNICIYIQIKTIFIYDYTKIVLYILICIHISILQPRLKDVYFNMQIMKEYNIQYT